MLSIDFLEVWQESLDIGGGYAMSFDEPTVLIHRKHGHIDSHLRDKELHFHIVGISHKDWHSRKILLLLHHAIRCM